MAQRTFIVPALMVGFSAAFALPGPLVFPRQATEPDLNTHVYLDYCGDEVGLRTAVYFDKIPANPDVDSPIALSDTDVAWDAGNDATHRFYETGEADPVYWTVQDSTSKIRGGSLGLPVGSYVGQFELIRTEQDREYLDGLNCFVEPATSSITHPVFGYFCYPQALCTKRNAQQVTFSASRQTIEINTPTTGDGGNARTAKDIINRAAEAVNDDNRSCDPTPFSVSRGGTCTMVVDCNDPDGRAKEKFAAAIAAFADNEAGSSYRTEEIVGDGCIELGTCDHENCVGVVSSYLTHRLPPEHLH